MTLVNTNNIYSTSKFIVDNSNPASPYPTIQSAINAAQAMGGSQNVWIRTGTYTENLTLYSGINLEGQEQSTTIIIGTHTPPISGSCRCTRIGFQATSGSIFTSAAAGTAILSCLRCQFTITNGYIYNLANWTGELRLRWCTDYSTSNGIVYNQGGAIVTMNHNLLGLGTGQTFTANGNVFLFSMYVACPMLLNGTGISFFQGGSVFRQNITLANTHTLTFAQCRMNTGANQAITNNSSTTLLLEGVVLNSSNANIIGGTGTVQLNGVEFPLGNGISANVALTGVTRTAEIWADNLTRQNFTGFYSWAASGPYYNAATLGTFSLLVGGTGYIQGKKVTWAGSQSITGMTAGNTYYIYIDNTGTIGSATTRTDALYINNIVLFECLRDSTTPTNNQVVTKENHSYSFPTSDSNFLHNNAGSVIQNDANGANIVLNGTNAIQINGADTLNDHGLSTIIPDSGGVAITWNFYYTLASGKWAKYSSASLFPAVYNNAGTITALTGSQRAIFNLYVAKDDLNSSTPSYYAVINNAVFANIGTAQAAVTAGTFAYTSGELAQLELVQLGQVIYGNNTSTLQQVTISKTTLRSATSSGGSSTASLITTNTANFNNVLTSADTNVQAALDTINNLGGGTYWNVTAATTITPVVSNGYATTAATLITATLPATVAVGRVFEFLRTGSGNWHIAQNAGQSIKFGTATTTTGVTGYLESANVGDAIKIVCIVANTTFYAVSVIGDITVN